MSQVSPRDRLDVDVLFVGAGPASLAGALALSRKATALGTSLSILVIDKADEVGHHNLSGAVLDARALDELAQLGAWTTPPPLDTPVTGDAVWMMQRGFRLPLPWVPPALRNAGKHVISLQRLVQWLAREVEAVGVDVYPAFAGAELLYDDQGAVAGVQLGDTGIGRDGSPRPQVSYGAQIFARYTVLGDGVRGNLSKVAIERYGLAGPHPQVYALGVKELWKLPPGRVQPGNVVHTLGYPLPHHTFGGGWIYGLRDDVLDLGLVVGLDSPDPTNDPHRYFNAWKSHPEIRALLEGGECIAYGARSIPEGGWFALPRLVADGMLLVGDAAGTVNSLRLKGIHLAMKSGMLAAESILRALEKGRNDAAALASYDEAVRASWIGDELRSARNIHQGFQRGFLPGLINAGLAMATGGRGFGCIEELSSVAGHERMQPKRELPPPPLVDGKLTLSKLDDVYLSKTRHEEDQPSHLRVYDTTLCADQCTREYGNPCQYFCPAQVYHPEFEEHDGVVTGGLRIDFANCVHCKTCDILDPYQQITWVPPQGGDGPRYVGM